MAYKYVEEQLKIKKGRPRINLADDKDTIIDMYVNKHMSLVSIAEIFGCDYNTVKNNLKNWEVYIVNRRFRK